MTSGKAAFLDACSVSRETLERLERFEALILKWNKTINLIAKSTEPEIWTRHFLESAQSLQYRPVTGTRWIDLGSGGGFPAMIVAILAKEEAQDLTVTCVESDIRKGAFLRSAAGELEVSLSVATRRIEEMPAQDADVLSARALAPLSKLLGYAERHLGETGRCIFLKGERWRQEVEEALENFRFSFENHPSPSNPASAILVVKEVTRA